MSAEFSARLRRYADVIVRVGLNLRRGQRVLLAEPFELQGVAREAAPLVDAIGTAARAAGAVEVEVIWSDAARWRAAATGADPEFEREIAAQGERMRRHARSGGALVFLPSGNPALMRGAPARQVARLREAGWRAYGRVAPDLIAGRTNWTSAPAPTATWASAVFPGIAAEPALDALWSIVFEACRGDAADPMVAWREHLAVLDGVRDELNRRRATAVVFRGEGTALRVPLAPAHRWCTAALRTTAGDSFLANLPTEEVFTAPDRAGADGVVRVARPFPYGGGVIAGAVLEFARGEVVRARAGDGDDLLQRLLATDAGASRLGEVALVPRPLPALAGAGVPFFNTLLDENTLPHIALGEAYPFSVERGGADALNHSLVHVDLPIAAEVIVE